MLGVLFAILSAASFGLNSVNIRRGVLSGSPAHAIYVTVILGVPFFLVAALVTGQVFHVSLVSPRGYLLLAAAGVLHFIAGRYCNYRAIKVIGANRAAPLQAVALMISVLVAIFLLGERVTAVMVIGILLIIIGPAIVVERSKQVRQNPGFPPKGVSLVGQTSASIHGASLVGVGPHQSLSLATNPKGETSPLVLRQAEGYLFGLMAATAWGITPIMIRSALLETNLGILGGLISYAAAAAVLILSLVLPGRLANLQAMSRTSMRWFLQASVSGFLAQMFWYLALGIIPVTVAAPLQRTTALFILLFSFLVNRKIESFGPRVIAGIVLSVVGSLALAL